MIKPFNKINQNPFSIRFSLRSEVIIFIALLLVFLTIGLTTSSRMKLVSIDEVAYTEPAVNLYKNGDFTSSVLWYQQDGEFFAGSTLLYPLMLSGWFYIWGFSILSARMLNFILIISAATMILIGLKKTNIVHSGFLRIIVVALVLFGDSLSYSLVNGRYDISCLFLISLIFLVYSINKKIVSYVILVFLGILVPLAGLSLTIYAFILAFLVLLFQFRIFIKPWTSIMIGIFMGIIFLYCLFSYHNVLDDYLKYSFGHAKLLKQTSLFDPSIFVTGLFARLSMLFNPQNYECAGCKDVKSFLILFLALNIAFIHSISLGKISKNPMIFFGLTVSILIPSMMCIVGIYPRNYSWMSFTPLAISVCASAETSLSFDRRRFSVFIFLSVYLLLFLVAIWPGVPKNLYKTIRSWDRMNYKAVDVFIDQVVKPEDRVYADFSAYYSLKKKVTHILFPTHLKIASDNEKRQISVIIYDPRDWKRVGSNPGLAEIKKSLGGRWYDVGYTLGIENGYKPLSSYKLRAYRRDN